MKDRDAEFVLELILDNTKCTSIGDVDILNRFKNLESLSLNGVGLVDLDGFPSLPRLTRVRVLSTFFGARKCVSGFSSRQRVYSVLPHPLLCDMV